MWAAIGRNGFAAMLILSVTLHGAAAVWFSLEATEPPVALASVAGKASMSIRASAGARPRVVGDGASAGSAAIGAASTARPTPIGARPPDQRIAPVRAADRASPLTQRRPGERAPERNGAPARTALAPQPALDSHPTTHAVAPPQTHPPIPEAQGAAAAPPVASSAPPDHAVGHTITALTPAPGADHSRANDTPLKPPSPRTDKPTPGDRAEAPPVRSTAPPPTQVAQAPIRKPVEDAPAPSHPIQPSPRPAQQGEHPAVASAPPHTSPPPKEQVAVAGDHPSAKPGRPTLPGLENAKNVADEASPSSAGSAGSEGVEADDLPQGLAVNPPPPYPDDALADRLEGSVLLWVKIDASGRVASIRVQETSGVESLDRSALTTVRRWQFSPAKRRGVPVPFEFYWPVRFRIPGR